MKIIKQLNEILAITPDPLELIEMAGRTCYRSEPIGNPAAFVRKIVRSGHHSVIEHVNMTVRFVTDRGVSHELVRHRLAAYSQESTRYADYSADRFDRQISVVLPVWYNDIIKPGAHKNAELAVMAQQLYDGGTPLHRRAGRWLGQCVESESSYLDMIVSGASPQEARSVLPNSLKTEVIMTANLREWRHVLDLRCSKAAHPQMRELMLPLMEEILEEIPEVFEL